jgi:hypothetical protein
MNDNTSTSSPNYSSDAFTNDDYETGSYKDQPKDYTMIMTDTLKFLMIHRLEIF